MIAHAQPCRLEPIIDRETRMIGSRDYLSYSALSTYRTYPLKYYFRYVAELTEERTSANLVFGSGIHAAIQAHFERLLVGENPLEVADLLEHYDQSWNAETREVEFSGAENRESLKNLAAAMLCGFLASEVAKPVGRVLAIEEEFRGEAIEGLPDILARIDLIEETPEALVIRDWKTSRSRWSPIQVESSAEQLTLYAALLRSLGFSSRLRGEFIVFTKTKEAKIERHTLQIEECDLERTKRGFARVWRAISEGHFYPAPSVMACGGCPFRGPCRQSTN